MKKEEQISQINPLTCFIYSFLIGHDSLMVALNLKEMVIKSSFFKYASIYWSGINYVKFCIFAA